MNGKYIGTFVVPGSNPRDVMYRRGSVVVADSFARRRGPVSRAWKFIKQCRLWWRVQRLGSKA